MSSVAALLEIVRRDQKTATVYVLAGVGCFFIYLILKWTGLEMWDHYMTFSAVLQTMAFGLLAMKVQRNDVAGLSPTMMTAYCVSYVSRLSTTLTLQGYLPEDVTGEVYLYQLSEFAGLVIVGYCLSVVVNLRQRSGYMDDVQPESPLTILGMIVVCAGLGLMTKSDGHNHYYGDWLWMFAQWMDSIAIAPQLWIVAQKKEVERRTSHFIALMIAARIVLSLFWISMMVDYELHWHFAVGIMVTNILHVVLCADYMYYFACTIRAPKMALPGMAH